MRYPDMSQQQPSLADFELLAEVSQLLTLTDLDGVLHQVIDLIKRAIGATKASLFLHHQNSDQWQRLLTARNLGAEESLLVVQSVIDKGLAGWVIRNRRGTVVYDTHEDDRWHIFPDDTTVVRSVMCLPLMQDSNVLAVITLVHPEANRFTEHQLRLLTIIANQITVAVRNAQLFHQQREQQRQLEAMIHAIPDVLLVTNDAGDILLVNDAAVDLMGKDAQADVIGGRLSDLYALDTALASLESVFAKPMDTGETIFETRSDGQRRDFVVNVSRWENAPSLTAGYVIVMHDVTMIRDLNQFKGDMLKIVSHDLRSPLALIVGYVDLIEMDTVGQDGVQEYLGVVRRSTQRMNMLLDDLLKVEEIRSSPDELLCPTDFGELVGQVFENLKLIAGAKAQTVTLDVQLDGLSMIRIDPMMIRESMENLVSNSVKYTGDGGTIHLQSYYDDRRVYFTIEDNGIGISENELIHIFEYGYRAKRSAVEATDGKGMGLSLVKTVIERHGGDVWAESWEDKGSRFGFWLPR